MAGKRPCEGATPEAERGLPRSPSSAGGAVTREDHEARIRAELSGTILSQLQRLWIIGWIRFEVWRIGSEHDAQAPEAFLVDAALDSALSVVDRRLRSAMAPGLDVHRRWVVLSELLSQAMGELGVIAQPVAAESSLPHRRRLRDQARPSMRDWFVGRARRSIPAAAAWGADRWARIELAMVDDGAGFENVRRSYADLLGRQPIPDHPVVRSGSRWRE